MEQLATEIPEEYLEGKADGSSHSDTTSTQSNVLGLASNPQRGDYDPVRQERFEWIPRFDTSREETFRVEDSGIRLLVVPSGSQRDQFAGPVFVETGAHLVFCYGYFSVSTIVECQPSGTEFDEPLFLDFCVEDVSDGEWNSSELGDERENERDAHKERRREAFKVRREPTGQRTKPFDDRRTRYSHQGRHVANPY